jgi:hypothetical protein
MKCSNLFQEQGSKKADFYHINKTDEKPAVNYFSDKNDEYKGKIKNYYIWHFPQTIKFINISDYLKMLDDIHTMDFIILDMSNVEDAHSSFIGFLIYFKNINDKIGLRSIYKMSPYVKQTCTMLGVYDFLSNNVLDRAG